MSKVLPLKTKLGIVEHALAKRKQELEDAKEYKQILCAEEKELQAELNQKKWDIELQECEIDKVESLIAELQDKHKKLKEAAKDVKEDALDVAKKKARNIITGEDDNDVKEMTVNIKDGVITTKKTFKDGKVEKSERELEEKDIEAIFAELKNRRKELQDEFRKMSSFLNDDILPF